MAAPAPTREQQQPQQVVELVDGSAMAPIIDPSLTMTSLYVGDLNPEVNEAMLFDRFSPSGTIASIRVCRDHVTRRSLRYAYVNFQTHEDAKRALEDLNFELLKDKAMRISWSNRDPSVRRNNDANIFIKNLERSIDSKHLLDTFQSFGDVVSCKVATDDRGESKGYGFVHFANPQDATRALETVNGKAINGQTVTIAKFLPKRERQEQQGGRAQQFTNVYVKNLPLTLTEDGLLAVFSKSGKVTSHFIKRDENGASKGFGFVNFENPEDAVKAVDSLNNSELEGQKLFVSRAQKRNERRLMLEEQHENLRKEREEKTRGVNLYIKNLDENIDDEALRNAFAKFGTITSVKVMRDERSKASKGFGFVCFSAPEEATKAMTEMSSKIIAVKPLYIAPAQRKAEREALMSQRHQMPFARGQMMPPFQQMGMYPPMYPYRAGQIPRGNRQYQQMMPPMGPMGGPGLGGRMVPQQGVPQGMALAPGQVQQLPQMAPQGMPSMGRGGRRQPGGARGGAVQQQQQRGMRQPLQQQQQQQQFQQQQMQQQRMMPAPQMGGMEDLANLVDAPPEKKKQMLGERLYPLIHQTYGEQAGKITGMLLAMEDSELLHLLEDKDALKEKAAEAQKVLEEHMRQKEQ